MFERRPPNAPAWQQYRPQLAAYAHAPVNYDPSQPQTQTPANGWRADARQVALPAEAPGPPAPAGSFAAAQAALWGYAFPPPSLLVGYFDPQPPLAARIMVLRARFLGLSFLFGVRIVAVVDAVEATPLGPVQVWGYGYRTLRGHFEQGQINFHVRKNLATGTVSFHLTSVSRPAAIRNPFYWLGFKLFGRLLQRRFARQSLARLRQLVEQALAPPQTMPTPAG